MTTLSQRLQGIRQAGDLANITGIIRGLEKESLRVSPQGTLANSAHAETLGSALTHPHITTDYSEALLEFITSPSGNIEQLIRTLDELHRYTYQCISKEVLWVNSMPCMLSHDSKIPIAQYGSSNSGQMKSIYRIGLGHRYGRAMQTIAGIHFNFSVSDQFWRFLKDQDKSILSLKDYKTHGYFRLIRNFRRYFWLLLYLFGAAPGVCHSFIQHRQHQLVPVGDDHYSLHTPYATSLRMGDLGYQSSAQESLVITYNCLQTYANTLCQAITKTHPGYASLGVKDKNDNYLQLNDSLLQIENEFYSVIRPKRTAASGQTALNALTSGGVEYIEVRCLDLNPYEPVGIGAGQIRFLDIFLLFCLMEDSPESDEREHQHLQENQRRMVYRGRDPELMLYHFGQERPARQWGNALFQQFQVIANLLDTAEGGHHYQDALVNEKQKLSNERLTPSARILEDMREQGITFYRLAMNAALTNSDYFHSRALSAEKTAFYKAMAAKSLQDQAAIEAGDTISLEQFLTKYYQQYQCYSAEGPLAIAK
ncbi:MAG: glutamate--cysteine ligase [Pseudomonadota bacterium]